MNNGEQSTIFPADKAATGGRKTFTRNCEECSKGYEAVLKTSKYCSERCYRSAKRKNAIMKNEPSVDGKLDKKISVKSDVIPSPSFSNLSPQMLIAIDLLKQDSARWKEFYNEEKDERKKFQEENAKLKEQIQQIEHKQTLQGIEDKKPDFIDRLGNLPPQLIEAFTPLIGRLGAMLIPEAPAAMAGIGGQLDEVQIQLLTWISSLPESAQKNLLAMLAALTHMDEPKLMITLSQFQNLLMNGTTINKVNDSMYG